jgi:beta-galactosidase
MTTRPAPSSYIIAASASRYAKASALALSPRQKEGASAPGVCTSPGCPPSQTGTPTFFRATFTLARTGDTFLDIRNLGKGALWINGHIIGRFWNVGPQQTLYVPGPWLRKGRNQITIFDLAPQSSRPHVAGLAQPILNGPVADQTTSKQE